MSSAFSQSKLSDRPDKRAARPVGVNQKCVEISLAALTATVIPHPSREQLVREAAYHHAESRGFEQGHEVEDWLAAEAEVDARLSGEGWGY